MNVRTAIRTYRDPWPPFPHSYDSSRLACGQRRHPPPRDLAAWRGDSSNALHSLFPQVAATSADAVLDGLDPEQREVATALHGPVCVLAGAGTGKTRAITHRIAYGVRAGILQPASVLAVTFTNRAAGEMRGRLRQLGAGGVQARTFHSAALRQLQFFWPKAVGGELPRLLERKIQLVAEAAARCRIRLDRNELRDVTGEIEWAKVTQTVPADYPAAVAKSRPRRPARPGRDRPGLRHVRAAQARPLGDRLRGRAAAHGRHPPGPARHRRPGPRASTSTSWSTSTRTSARSSSGCWSCGSATGTASASSATPARRSTPSPAPPPTICSTSAPATPSATVVKLVRDYRSTPQVVHLANGLLAQARGRAAEHRLELISQRDAGPRAGLHGVRGRARRGRGHRPPHPRPHRRRRPGRRDRRALPDQRPVRGLRAGARRRRSALPAARRRAVLRAARGARGGRRPARRRPLRRQRLPARRRRRPALPGPGRALRRRAGPPSRPAGSGRGPRPLGVAGRPGAPRRGLRRAKPDGRPSPTSWPSWTSGPTPSTPRPSQGVTLASLHSAKGLEWDAVFLVGLTEGMMPITYAKTDEQIEEERRLLYVGVTRARLHLSLSWALSRSPGGRASRRPSRFLNGLRPGSGAPPAPARRGRRGRHRARQRRQRRSGASGAARSAAGSAARRSPTRAR